MKLRILSLGAVAALIAFASSFSVGARADTQTLSFTNTGAVTFDVPSNVVAEVIHANCHGSLSVTINGGTAFYIGAPNGVIATTNLPTVVGPASITITNGTIVPGLVSFLTVRTSPATSSPNFIPNTAVVIPADSSGPVTIILESSVDLVNWTPAQPGTYGTTSTNRFFRVRAQR
jgi:hypothetical protein